ncbi:hypothetical protein [Pseudomonas synxantha]|nr:hypothetical protein [Pseudomonas synxantha]
MRAVVVHAVVGRDQHLVAGVEPALQVVGQDNVGRTGAVAVLRGVEAMLVAGIVDIHRMHQQKVGRVLEPQALGIGEQMGIRIVVSPVEMPVLDRQCLVVGVTIAGGEKGRAVIQLADPVVSRRSGAQAGVGGVIENAALVGQARDVVMDNAAVNRWHAGEDAFIQRAGQGGQFAFQFVEGCASCADVGLQVSHGVLGDLEVQAVEHDKDDSVLHGGWGSATDGQISFFRLKPDQMWELACLRWRCISGHQC